MRLCMGRATPYLAVGLAWWLGGCGASSVAPPATGTTRATTTTAVRTLPAGYAAGSTITVTITVTPADGVANYAVEDTPPSGWTASAINESGTFDGGTGKVRWGPYFDANARTLSYQLTVPSGASGDQTFAGTVSADGKSQAVGGSTVLKPGSSGHPADSGGDGKIGITELTAYGKAWKSGATWPSGPNPIPIGYITNAGFLWKNGESYDYDATKNPPFVKGSGGGGGGETGGVNVTIERRH